MAESNGLLNRRTGFRTGGSNPPLSAKFNLKKPFFGHFLATGRLFLCPEEVYYSQIRLNLAQAGLGGIPQRGRVGWHALPCHAAWYLTLHLKPISSEDTHEEERMH